MCLFLYKSLQNPISGAVADPHYLRVWGLRAGQPPLSHTDTPQPPLGRPSLAGCVRVGLKHTHPGPTLVKCLSRGQNPGNPAPVSLYSHFKLWGHFSPKPSASLNKGCPGVAGRPGLHPKGSLGRGNTHLLQGRKRRLAFREPG